MGYRFSRAGQKNLCFHGQPAFRNLLFFPQYLRHSTVSQRCHVAICTGVLDEGLCLCGQRERRFALHRQYLAQCGPLPYQQREHGYLRWPMAGYGNQFFQYALEPFRQPQHRLLSPFWNGLPEGSPSLLPLCPRGAEGAPPSHFIPLQESHSGYFAGRLWRWHLGILPGWEAGRGADSLRHGGKARGEDRAGWEHAPQSNLPG